MILQHTEEKRSNGGGGGEGSLRFANRYFYVFFFEGFCRDEFYANIMM